MQDNELLQFPARFPLKVMGRDEDDFETLVVEIVNRHVEGELDVKTRPSRDGNFIAVTVTFEAHSKDQLDALYRELTGHDRVLMAL